MWYPLDMMAAIPTGRPDIPMMPMPVYPNPGFMHAPDNPHINKLPVAAARGLHNTHISTTTAPPSEPVQLISSNQQNNKTPGASSDGTNETGEHNALCCKPLSFNASWEMCFK